MKIRVKKRKFGKDYLVAGFVGGFTAVTCCIAPIVIVFMGLGTSLALMIMHQFHAVSIFSGLIFMGLICFFAIKKKHGVCNIGSVKKSWKNLVFAFSFMLLSLFFLNGFVIEPLATKVYAGLDVDQKPLGNLASMVAVHKGMSDMGSEMMVMPENEGVKKIFVKIDGVFCGSCGPALEYDLKNVLGVREIVRTEGFLEGSVVFEIIYDSDVTNKDIILKNVHEPYFGKILKEESINEKV